MTLLYGSCSVNDTPDVWQCVRSILERSSFAPSCVITRYQSSRAARSFDTSMRSEEHTSELQSPIRTSYAVFCLKKKKRTHSQHIDRAQRRTLYIDKHTVPTQKTQTQMP